MLNSDNAIWDDGEWVGWDEINQQIQYHEWREKYPNANMALVPVLETLLATAGEFHWATGKHLQVYGDIGELFAAITIGMSLNKDHAQGSDGRLGNDFIEVKTIAPFSTSDRVTVHKSGNFSKLMVVKISDDFQVSYRLVKRCDLPKRKGNKLTLRWADLEALAMEGAKAKS